MSGTKHVFDGLDEAALARFFREMADRLEGATPEGPETFGVDPGDFFKLKLSLKREADGYAVKMKAKPYDATRATGASVPVGTEDPAGTDAPKVKYKSLKKRMKGQFKTIAESLVVGVLPPAAVAEAFLADSRRMTAYPGYGDEFYAEYDSFRVAFRDALEREDMEGCRSVVRELDRIKKECHDRYK